MLSLSLVPLFGVALAGLACWFIRHNQQGRCKEILEEADERVRDKLRRAKDLDAKLVENILGGVDIDEAIETFTKNRAAIHTLPSNAPALWEAEDLKKASATEVRVQTAAVLSHARLVSFSVCTVVFLAVAAIEAILYSQLSTTQPILSPQAVPKKAFSNSALPTP